MTIIEGLTLAVALLGAFLGILNTLHEYNQDKIKIKVIPSYAFEIGPGADEGIRPCIDVANLGSFAITISQVGFMLNSNEILIYLSPNITGGGSFPKRLEAHSSLSVFYDLDSHKNKNFPHVKCAFAKTDCGTIVKGKSPALKALIRLAKAK